MNETIPPYMKRVEILTGLTLIKPLYNHKGQPVNDSIDFNLLNNLLPKIIHFTTKAELIEMIKSDDFMSLVEFIESYTEPQLLYLVYTGQDKDDIIAYLRSNFAYYSTFVSSEDDKLSLLLIIPKRLD